MNKRSHKEPTISEAKLNRLFKGFKVYAIIHYTDTLEDEIHLSNVEGNTFHASFVPVPNRSEYGTRLLLWLSNLPRWSWSKEEDRIKYASMLDEARKG